MYETKILLDSISPGGARLTTAQFTYPRMVHAELMTHRKFSKNSASSRAIPNEKLRRMVAEDPALPVWWGKNQSGMQAREELIDKGQPLGNIPLPYIEAFPLSAVKEEWLRARDCMLEASERLSKIGLHKQLCNRLIEPWMFITVIVSSTEWDNFFHLRDHKDAQPEIAWIAKDFRAKYEASTPLQRTVGDWHLPLFDGLPDSRKDWDSCVLLAKQIVDDHPLLRDAEPEMVTIHRLTYDLAKKVSTGRVARVSLLTHDGKRDLAEDIGLHDKLLAGKVTGDPMHMSPFEHVAVALHDPHEKSGNFDGWGQYRKEIPGENYMGTRL